MERTIHENLDKKHVWHPFTQEQTAPDNTVIVKAKGALLFDENDNEFIDVNSSWWVNVHGHCHPHIGNAITKQLEELDHVIFAGVTHPQGIHLAQRISTILPGKLNKVFFSDNGSTAVEVALKMCFQYWYNKNEDRKKFVALNGAYHGDTFGAMSISQRGYFNQPFEHLFFNVDFIAFPDDQGIEQALKELQILLATNEIAGIIFEPLVQGSSGMRMYGEDALEKLVELAQDADVPVIFDEIMTGFGRTGKYFAMNHTNIKPDIVCLSKGLTGGVLPLGLTVASDEIYNAFLHPEKTKALLHGHSYTGNPLVCAAANASLDLFEQPETWGCIERIENSHREFAQLIALKHYPIAKLMVCGTILRFEILEQKGDYFSTIRDKAYTFFLSHGILLRPLGNVLFLNPPYCIESHQLEKVYETVQLFLEDLARTPAHEK